jgi:MFS family permease
VPTMSSRPAIFYGWFIVAITFLIALVTAGGRNAFGVFVIPMSEEFGWNRSAISLVAAIGSLINGFSQPLLGQIFDTFGGRKVILVSLAIFGGYYAPPGTDLQYCVFHRDLWPADVDGLKRDLADDH